MGRSEFEDGYDDENPGSHLETEEHRLGELILNAQIRALDPRPAIAVSEATSISDAIQLMIERHVGAVLVLGEGRIVGIFTERDVLRRVVVSGIDRERPVREVMTAQPETLGLDDGIAFALNRMIARGFRHIPIVDAAGQAVAVLSVREVVAYIVSLLPKRVHNLPPEPQLGIAHTLDGG